MKELKVDVKDYLTDARIERIVEEELRNALRCRLRERTDIEDFIVNASYKSVGSMINDILGDNEDYSEQIADKIFKIISDQSSLKFEMFREDGRKNSKAREIMNEILEGNRDYIQANVLRVVDKYVENDLMRELQDEIEQVVQEVIWSKFIGDIEEK